MDIFGKSPVSKSAGGMNYQEIKSHSSLLSNERIAILFYMLDLSSMNLNTYYNEDHLMRTKSILFQVYKNVRSIVRNNRQVRMALNLETKEPGVYTLDLGFDIMEQMVQYCTFHGFTYKRCYAIAQQLNNMEMILRDVLQFFSYFFRPEYKQKPDIMIATEKYKQMADGLTIEQLKGVLGKRNRVDFRSISDGSISEFMSKETEQIGVKDETEEAMENDEDFPAKEDEVDEDE